MTNNTSDKTKIADHFTVAHWRAMKAILQSNGSNPEIWDLAFNIFFKTRIETRYFEPIRLLQKHGENKGEGFAIVALQCSLIEFLASTIKGVSPERDIIDCDKEGCEEKIINNSSISSAKLFKDFLKNNKPFSSDFKPNRRADSFYKDVRCALLHDARTKGNWIIRAESDDDKTIKWENENDERILYRNNLQKAFEKYIDDYGKELKNCKCLQEAFIRKFDSLCKE